LLELPGQDLTSAGESRSSDIEHPIAMSSGRLGQWLDPEWLLFEAFLLGPALLCLHWGDGDRAVFYGRLALHLGCLKWLGWAILTRALDPQPLRF
jgi:hypothetical protein